MTAHSQKTRIRKARPELAEDGWSLNMSEPSQGGDRTDTAPAAPSGPGHALAAMQIVPQLDSQAEMTGSGPNYQSAARLESAYQQMSGPLTQRAQHDDPRARGLNGEAGGAGLEQPESTVGPAGGPLGPAMTARIEAARGSGSALDGATRGSMEGAFGSSFAGVRVHTDGEADALNRGVSAVAFTTGSDIFFRQGAFQPGTPEGKQLLAHELTHVVQQRGMSGGGPLTVGAAGDSYEQQADATAASVTATAMAPGSEAAQPAVSGPVRRESDPQQGQGDGQQGQGDGQQAQGDGGLQAVAGEQTIDLPVPESVTLALDGGMGPGDYPGPSDPNQLMAKHVGVPFLQRDDTPPQGSSGGGDAGGGQPSNQASAQSGVTLAGPKQAPYQIQVTRTLHLIPPLSLDQLHIDFFQDPQITVGLDSQGTLSAQLAQDLFMIHFLPNWKAPVDLGLSAIWQQNIAPKLQSQQGGQLQAEAHVSKTFSVTWTIQGMRTDSDDGKSRVWSVTTGAGIISYF